MRRRALSAALPAAAAVVAVLALVVVLPRLGALRAARAMGVFDRDADADGSELGARRVVLTFDDGPSPHLPRLLALLERHGAPAAFFFVGRTLAERAVPPGLAARLACSPLRHALGSHTQTHVDVRSGQLNDTERVDRFVASLRDGVEALRDAFGLGAVPFRFPFGFVTQSMHAAARALGALVVGWSLDSSDWRQHGPEALARTLLTQLEALADVGSGAMILMHEYEHSVDALEMLLPDLVKLNYTFLSLPEAVSQEQLREWYVLHGCWDGGVSRNIRRLPPGLAERDAEAALKRARDVTLSEAERKRTGWSEVPDDVAALAASDPRACICDGLRAHLVDPPEILRVAPPAFFAPKLRVVLPVD